jgi:hypothetical protein
MLRLVKLRFYNSPPTPDIGERSDAQKKKRTHTYLKIPGRVWFPGEERSQSIWRNFQLAAPEQNFSFSLVGNLCQLCPDSSWFCTGTVVSGFFLVLYGYGCVRIDSSWFCTWFSLEIWNLVQRSLRIRILLQYRYDWTRNRVSIGRKTRSNMKL